MIIFLIHIQVILTISDAEEIITYKQYDSLVRTLILVWSIKWDFLNISYANYFCRSTLEKFNILFYYKIKNFKVWVFLKHYLILMLSNFTHRLFYQQVHLHLELVCFHFLCFHLSFFLNLEHLLRLHFHFHHSHLRYFRPLRCHFCF